MVIDAPLLFEAGLDRECDAVVFVDAPRAERAERARRDRGRTEGELDRREKAQLPLEHKRERSDYTVDNAGSADEIDRQVEGVLRAIHTSQSAAGEGLD